MKRHPSTGTSAGEVSRNIDDTAYDVVKVVSDNMTKVVAVAGALDNIMDKPIYDAADVNEQLVGISAVQIITNKTLTDSSNLIYADAVHFKVKANEAILRGQPLVMTGYNQGEDATEVSLADQATDVTFALAENDILVGEIGSAIQTGTIHDVDTSAWTVNTLLYVNGTGTLTATEPTSGISQPVGRVLRQNANNGHIAVSVTRNKQTASTVPMATIGAPTYSTVQQMNDTFHSSGHASGGNITDVGSGNITVDLGSGYIRATDSSTAELLMFDWSALGSTTIPIDTTRYIGIEYSAGTPQVVVRILFDWNFNTDFPLGTVNNEDNNLHIISTPHGVGDHANGMLQRMSQTMGIQRDKATGGLILGETGTRNIAMTVGGLWEYLKRYTMAALDTSISGTFDAYYGSFTKVPAQTQWDNIQYDNAGALTDLTANKYGVHWFYLELDGELVSIYGNEQYTSAALAEAASPPTSVPIRLTNHAILIGQLIFKKSESTAISVNSAFLSVFSASVAADHINLSNIGTKTHVELEAEKADLSGATFTGLVSYDDTVFTTNIDCSLGNSFSKTVIGSFTQTFSNVPATGSACIVTLKLINAGSWTITWDVSIKWAGGEAPTFTASGVDSVVLYTIDGGTTWYGNVNIGYA